MTAPDTPQPDDEQPVTDTPDARQPKPDSDLAQDDDLRSGQWSPQVD